MEKQEAKFKAGDLVEYVNNRCNKRDYEATHQVYCPYAQRSRIPYQRKRKKTSDAQMPLFNINDYGESEEA